MDPTVGRIVAEVGVAPPLCAMTDRKLNESPAGDKSNKRLCYHLGIVGYTTEVGAAPPQATPLHHHDRTHACTEGLGTEITGPRASAASTLFPVSP